MQFTPNKNDRVSPSNRKRSVRLANRRNQMFSNRSNPPEGVTARAALVKTQKKTQRVVDYTSNAGRPASSFNILHLHRALFELRLLNLLEIRLCNLHAIAVMVDAFLAVAFLQDKRKASIRHIRFSTWTRTFKG